MSDKNLLVPTITKNVSMQAGGRWAWETKQEVVEKMLMLGNIQLVSSLTGVDVSTIQNWKKQPWWTELVATYREEKALVVDSKMASIVDKALEKVDDRLENGDIVLNNKTGELIRKPVSMKDAALVARDLLVRQEAIRKSTDEAVEHKETVKETLSLLAKEFAKWAKKEPVSEIVDVESKEI